MTEWTNFSAALNDVISSEQVGLFSTLVSTKTYDKLDAKDFGFLVEGVRTGDAVVNMISNPSYNAIPNVTGNDCDITACDFEADYEGAVWELVMAECRYPVCTRKAPKKFMALYQKYKAINPGDSEYDFIIEQMSDIISDILSNSLVAKLFLSNKDLTETTINGIDGWIEQWKDGNGQTSEVVNGFDTTDGQAWYEAIIAGLAKFETGPYKALTDQTAIIIDEAGARAISNWLNSADNLKGVDCACYDPDGVTTANRFSPSNLQIAGHKVVPVPYTDMAIQFDELSTTGTLNDPVFAVITPLDNNLIGAPANKELEMNDSFYDNKDRTYYFDAGYQYGAVVASGAYVLITEAQA
jgi:hypothetical protein